MVTLFHEFEEDVGLLGFYINVSEFIDAEHVHVGEHFEEPAAGAIRERGIHFIEQILGRDEQRPIAVLHRFTRQTDHQGRLADACFPDENYIGSSPEFVGL
jgi:hypothetical protein